MMRYHSIKENSAFQLSSHIHLNYILQTANSKHKNIFHIFMQSEEKKNS